jgi:hypothetical protein
MIRIAAMLSKITKVTDGFAEQLTKNASVYIEEGILNVTDQIMLAVDEDDDPDNVGSEAVMATTNRSNSPCRLRNSDRHGLPSSTPSLVPTTAVKRVRCTPVPRYGWGRAG